MGGPTNRSPVSLVSEGETVLPRQRYFSVWKMVSSYTKLLLCMENEFLLQNIFPLHKKKFGHLCAFSFANVCVVREKAHKPEVWRFVRFLLHNHICEGNRGVMVNPIRWFGSVAAGRSAGAHGTRLSARTQAAPNARIVFVKGPSDAGPGNTTTLRR